MAIAAAPAASKAAQVRGDVPPPPFPVSGALGVPATAARGVRVGVLATGVALAGGVWSAVALTAGWEAGDGVAGIAAVGEAAAETAVTWIVPLPKLAGIAVPAGSDSEPESVSGDVPAASAVNDAWSSATGSVVDTPGASNSGIAVQVASALPPALSIFPVTQMTTFSPLVMKPESLKSSSRSTAGSNARVRSYAARPGLGSTFATVTSTATVAPALASTLCGQNAICALPPAAPVRAARASRAAAPIQNNPRFTRNSIAPRHCREGPAKQWRPRQDSSLRLAA